MRIIEYIVITDEVQSLTDQINRLLLNGWHLRGETGAVYEDHNSSTLFFQVMVKYDDVYGVVKSFTNGINDSNDKIESILEN